MLPQRLGRRRAWREHLERWPHGPSLGTPRPTADRSWRQINTCFEIVAVWLDEKGGVERLSPYPGFAIAAPSKFEANAVKPVDGLFRRRAEREMNGAPPRLMP